MDADEYGEEVARLRLPVPVRGMNHLSDYLANAYGDGLLMHQEDQWLIVNRPV